MYEPDPADPATHVVELTPSGRGAVAVVLVEGPDATRLVDACFLPADGRGLASSQIGRVRLGHWLDADGEELIACRRSDRAVEVHCHGGIAAVRGVVEALAARGGIATPWQDWVRRSVPDPIRAEAQIALAHAPTVRTAAVLLDQFHGALQAAVRSIVAAGTSGDWSAATSQLDAVLAYRDVGQRLTKPWRVVLSGRPNVGKSSLMNAIVGFQRAIVCDLPGTTRDVVTAVTAIHGWPIQLADTAGLREADHALESAGVSLASVAAAEADLLVLVDDCTDPSRSHAGSTSQRTLRVLNKIDLLPTSAAAESAGTWDARTSAISGAGIDGLVTAIGKALVPTPPASGVAVPFTSHQVAQLEAALAAATARNAITMTVRLQPLLPR